MATTEVLRYAVTIPAGTTEASPATTDLDMPPRIVHRIRVRIPAGPNGLMGFRLTSGGEPVIPANGGWIVADDEVLEWTYVQALESGAWQLTGYNTGTYDHTVYLLVETDPVGAGAGAILSTPLVVTP